MPDIEDRKTAVLDPLKDDFADLGFKEETQKTATIDPVIDHANDDFSDLGFVESPKIGTPTKKVFVSEASKTLEVPSFFGSGMIGHAARENFWPELQKTSGESFKAVVRAGLNTAESVSSLAKFFGQDIEKDPQKSIALNVGYGADLLDSFMGRKDTNPVIRKIGQHVTERADRLIDNFDKLKDGFKIGGLEIAKADPEMFAGSFTKNPSWTRAVATIAEAVPSLATATAITFATKNPFAGAAALGLLEGATTREEALDAGASVDKANTLFFISSVGNTLLEEIPLGRFLRNKNTALKNIAEGFVFEGLQEGTQQVWQNAIAKFGYDETRGYFDGVVESLIAGAGSGGIVGSLTFGGGKQIDKAVDTLKQKGATDEDIQNLQKSAVEHVVENAEIIDNALDAKVAEIEQIASQAKEQPAIEPPTGRGGIVPPEFNFGKWKDQQAFLLSRETMERNLEGVIKDEKQLVEAKEFLTEPIKENETARVEWMNATRSLIKQEMNRLGIRHNSSEDKLVQRYGEGRMTEGELKSATPKWSAVKEAAAFFRSQYDEMLDTVNTVRAQFGYDEIPKRQDYFRHFQEIGSWIDSFGTILHAEDLPTEISGMTSMFKPGKPFTTAELRRRGGAFTESSIGGIDNYIDAISKQIFHTDSVQRARVIEKYIRTAGSQEQADLPNFVANIQEYANLLAGKKGSVDRAFESLSGREVYGAVQTIHAQISKNLISGNVSSALSNLIPFTQSMSTTKKAAAVKGLFEATYTAFRDDYAEIDGQKSKFLTRRFPDQNIALSIWQKSADKINFLFKSIDKFTSKAVLAGKYYEGIDSGLSESEAMKKAEEYAGKTLADRSIGQLPNLFGQKSLKGWTAFQVEVNNQVSFMLKDIPRQYHGDALKVASALFQFAIYSFLANEVYEKISGRRPQLDLIYATLTLLGMNKSGEKRTGLERVWQAFTDIRQNVPFGSFTTGRNFTSAAMPDIKGIITGRKDALSELSKTGLLLLNPFGGGSQIRKTIEGLNEYAKGGSFTLKRKTRRYRINQDFPNLVRGALFGKYAFPEAVDYYNKPEGKRR